MKRLAVLGFAVVAAVAAQAEKSVYEVSADGESGIDLVSLGDGYYQDRFSAANKTLCVTGTVTHAAIPEGSYFGLIGGGSSARLNLWSTGLFSNNTLNTPIRLEGTGGVFDFYEDTLTLGRDWAKWIAWDADKKTILRVKNITVTDTSGEPFTFEPEGVMRYGGVATGTYAAARIGMDGGRVTARFRNFFGSGGTSDKTANHDNRYSNYYIGGATASGNAAGYADVSYLRTDNQTDSDLGIIYFGYNVLAANSLQAAQGLTNILRLACGQVRILNMVRYGPESALVRFEREGAWIQIPGWHGELFRQTGTGSGDGRFVVESVNGATIKIQFSGQCTFGTSSRVEIRGDGDMNFLIGGGTNAMDRIVASRFDWNTSGDLQLTGTSYTTVEGENSLPHGAGHGDVSIACKAFIKENQTVNSLVGGGTLWNYAADPVTITVGADGGDCRYNVISATADVKTVKITSSSTAETIHNAGWDLVKTGAGNLTLLQAFPRHMTVEDGNLVIAKPMTLAANSVTLSEGASITLSDGTEMALGELMASLDDGYTHTISLVSGGTLTVGGDGADEEIDLANVAGDVTAVIHKIGSNKVTLKNYDNFRGVIKKDAGTVVPNLVSALTWTGGAGADTSFETLANWGLSEPALLRGFTATFATGGDTATVNETVPLAGLVFDQQAAGKSDFTVTGAGKVVLGATGIVTKEPPADGANAYTIAAPLELSESQTWWVTNGIGATPARQTSLRIAGPLSSVKSGITVTKKGWGDVWLCATNSTSTAAMTFATTGTVHVSGNNAWGAEGAMLTAKSGAKVSFEGGEFEGDVTTQLGSSSGFYLDFVAGSTNIFAGTMKVSGGHRIRLGSKTLVEFHKVFDCGGWTYFYGGNRNNSVFVFHDTCKIGSGEFNALTFDFRAPNNTLGNDFCLKYGGDGCRYLLNCEWAWNTTKSCQVWQDNLIDICGHNNRIGTFQMLSTSACVTNSGEKAAFWIDAQKEGVTEKDGGPQMPTTIRGHFRGPVTLGKTGPYDITVTNRAMTSSGDLVVAQGRLAFCDKSSWLNGREVVVTNAVGGGNAVLEIRQAKTLNRRATLRLGNGGTLRLGLAGVDAPFRQSVRTLFVDGIEQEAGVYSAADANGRPTVAGTRPCANLEGPGTLYVRGIGAVLIVR